MPVDELGAMRELLQVMNEILAFFAREPFDVARPPTDEESGAARARVPADERVQYVGAIALLVLGEGR